MITILMIAGIAVGAALGLLNHYGRGIGR